MVKIKKGHRPRPISFVSQKNGVPKALPNDLSKHQATDNIAKIGVEDSEKRPYSSIRALHISCSPTYI